jgi:hypothetical protein
MWSRRWLKRQIVAVKNQKQMIITRGNDPSLRSTENQPSAGHGKISKSVDTPLSRSKNILRTRFGLACTLFSVHGEDGS